jgi:prepilin-type N-terminal cleavage/methylation domain-containing protein/prepilin-type processing-associated H-X9-DG protein
MKRKGFTLIELLVVIAVIALLMAIVMPALGKAKMYAQRVICSNRVRQQALGIMLYANENNNYAPNPVPYNTSNNQPSAFWFWDISFWFTNQICEYAGFEKMDSTIFTCPSNKERKPNDALWWQYSWCPGGPSEQPLQDESVLSDSEQRSHYRVSPYIYLLDRYVKGYQGGDSMYTTGDFPEKTFNDRPMTDLVVRRFSNVKVAGSRKMVMDAVMSVSNSNQFSEIETSNGIFDKSEGTLTDGSNHLSRGSFKMGNNTGPKPLGMNIAYADGHADWLSAGDRQSNEVFDNIQVEYDYGQWFWW